MSIENKEEVDISLGLKNGLKKVGRAFMAFFIFYIRYIYVFFILMVLFVLYHLFFYKNSYESKVLVIQNFESENYLYQKINEIDSKITLKDTVYLKKVFGNHYKSLSGIDIEAIDDTYSFKSKTTNSIEIYRLLSNTKEAVDNILNYQESVYFKHHEITLKTSNKLYSEEFVKRLLEFLNDNEHYTGYADIYKSSLIQEIEDNEKTLAQINNILDHYYDEKQGVDGKNVVNINPSLDQLVREKRVLINNQLILKVSLSDGSQIIKPVTTSLNLKPEGGVPNKVKYFLISQFLYLIFLSLVFILKNRQGIQMYIRNLDENK